MFIYVLRYVHLLLVYGGSCSFVHDIITVSSGTITVNEESSVQILAEEAFPLDKFDLNVSMFV